MGEDVEHLLTALQNFPSLRLSAADMHKLSTDTVVAIYVEVLKALGVDVRNLKKPLKSETQFHISYYDPDFRFITKLFAVLSVIMRDNLPFEFDLTDILGPERNRTAAVITTIHNMILFKNSRKEELDEIVKEGSAEIEKFRNLAACKEELRDEINYRSKLKAKLLTQRDQLESQICEAEGRVFTLIEERENIKESIQPLCKTLPEYDNIISKLEAEGMKLVQAIEKLKNQIVASPDQLVQNLEDLKAKEQQNKEEECTISEGLQQKKAHFEKLANCAQVANDVMEEVKDVNKLIDEIRNEEMLVEQLETQKTKLNEEVSAKKDVIGWMKQSEVELQQKIKSSEEHLADKKEEAQKKMLKLDKEIALKYKTIEETTHTKQDQTKELETCKMEITKKQEQQSYILLKIDKESQAILEEVKKLTHAFKHLVEVVGEQPDLKK